MRSVYVDTIRCIAKDMPAWQSQPNAALPIFVRWKMLCIGDYILHAEILATTIDVPLHIGFLIQLYYILLLLEYCDVSVQILPKGMLIVYLSQFETQYFFGTESDFALRVDSTWQIIGCSLSYLLQTCLYFDMISWIH